MKCLAVSLVAACAFWLLLFSPWTADLVPFWASMAAATGVLAGLALWGQRQDLGSLFAFRRMWLAVGLGGAAVLYGVFWIGRVVSLAIFDFAPSQIASVYELRAGAPAAVIAVLLVVWIAPAEEIFWRGFLQKRLADRIGPWRGYLVAAVLYAAVHVWAFNVMLLIAALVCGVFWGWLMLRCKSLWPGIISHAAWDVTVFVLAPLEGT
ncbi:MAG: lysostaphin resistance A-like protein [Planctomycetota bacterium]|jgi:membrane protease YdiL (CAAX protease family)